MKKRVLITGINGFIGSALWSFFKGGNLPFEVFGVDVKAAVSSKKIFSCDLVHSVKFQRILRALRPDFIFHLVGGRSGGYKELFESNFTASQALFESIGKIKDYRPRVIVPGSAAEYGKAGLCKGLIKETDFLQPVSWYGLAKSAQTQLSVLYAGRGLDVVIGRIFNIMGPGTPVALSIGRFACEIALIEKSKENKCIKTRDLSGKRDFVDIRDVCSALLSLAQKGRAGEIYNICSGKPSTVRDLLKALINLSTARGISLSEDRNIMADSVNAIGSNTKIRRETGWRPVVSVKQSLKDTLNFYRLAERKKT